MGTVNVEKLTESEQIHAEWQAFSQTLAYKRLMEYIDIQKESYSILASGPLEVGTLGDDKAVSMSFEPEKYAYLLQRGVGCDIVKIYVEGYVNSQKNVS